MPIKLVGPVDLLVPTEMTKRDDRYLFDQIFRPYEVISWTDLGAMDQAVQLRLVEGFHPGPTPITSLYRELEGKLGSIRNRTFDYIASLEATDRAIHEVACSSIYQVTMEKLRMLEADEENPHVLITDSEGVAWGPLTLDPFKPPNSWPFPAKVGSVELRPAGAKFMDVVHERSTIERLEWPVALALAVLVNLEGLEEAIRRAFPGGVRIAPARW